MGLYLGRTKKIPCFPSPRASVLGSAWQFIFIFQNHIFLFLIFILFIFIQYYPLLKQHLATLEALSLQKLPFPDLVVRLLWRHEVMSYGSLQSPTSSPVYFAYEAESNEEVAQSQTAEYLNANWIPCEYLITDHTIDWFVHTMNFTSSCTNASNISMFTFPYFSSQSSLALSFTQATLMTARWTFKIYSIHFFHIESFGVRYCLLIWCGPAK